MTRRDLLKILLASAAAESVDFDRLLWTPKPIITIPALPPREAFFRIVPRNNTRIHLIKAIVENHGDMEVLIPTQPFHVYAGDVLQIAFKPSGFQPRAMDVLWIEEPMSGEHMTTHRERVKL